jgi:hypothetical protein
MSALMTAIVGAAIIGLAALSLYRFVKQRRLRVLLLQILSLVVVVLFLRLLFGFPQPEDGFTARGAGQSDLLIIAILFVCMILGMLAHWLYVWLEAPKHERQTFDFGLFIAPVLASPVVFIPLLASLQNANLNLSEMDIPRIMLFLVAFENGFFWKEYFENRRKKVAQ